MPTISIISPWAGSTASLLPDYDRATIGAELIIIDNACDEETRAALDTLPADRGKVIHNATNIGFAAGNNQGYAVAAGDIIIFLNSDVTAADAAWLRLVADDVKDGALYGPSLQSQLVAGRHLPYLEGWCIAATRGTWERLTDALCNTAFVQALPPNVTEKELALVRQELKDAFGDGRRMVVLSDDAKVELIQLAIPGPWDALNFQGPYWEDNKLCLDALRAGISLVQTTWPIQHKGGRTAGALLKHAQSFEKNRETFTRLVLSEETQVTHTPTYAAYQHHCVSPSDIQHHLPLLFSLARGHVVELGTRTGVSTAALLAGVEAHGGHVWSVDVDARSAKVADGHPQWTFIQSDSRNPELPAQIGTVNCLLIDTEHTRSMAEAELALWSDYMSPGSVILMHDPETFPGVRRAATEFAASKGWPITFVLPNNGMAVIERPK
jgi:cephalosporin hydroxylase